MKPTVVFAIVAWLAATADAYPQYQLSRDKTCTSCHLSPAGGALLNENGYTVAESTSQFGTKPEFMYGKVPTPDWLALGGDVRAVAGTIKNEPAFDYAAFPMQLELYARATFGAFSIHVTGGVRKIERNDPPMGTSSPFPWSREHYITWKQKPDENYGLYVRAGRFMPVFGLRFAEHTLYTRRFGGTQLYSDTYGVAVEYIDEKLEVHGTGFVEDPVISDEHASGGALYGELRTSETMSIGAEAMFKNFGNGEKFASSEAKELRLGVTHKLYLAGPDLLFQSELQFINGIVTEVGRSPASQVGGAPKGFAGAVFVSRMFGDFLLLDVGLQHYISNYRVSNSSRDAVDVNFHWFTTSHLEMVFNGRFELEGFGKGGTPGAYGLLQAHYRL